MNSKTCLKCGHIASYDKEPPLSCPACSAIYARVEEALRNGTLRRQESVRPISHTDAPTASKAPPTQRPSQQSPTTDDVHEYARRLAETSLYPTWRKLSHIATWIGYLFVALCTVIGFLTIKPSLLQALAILGGASFFILILRVAKEASLMLADLSDAAVRQAMLAEQSK